MTLSAGPFDLWWPPSNRWRLEERNRSPTGLDRRTFVESWTLGRGLINVTTWIRRTVVVVLIGHGLIHLLGAAKGLGWAEVAQLREPISTLGGLAWLVAAVLVIAAGVLIATRGPSWWWAVAGVAAGFSEVVIVTSWNDAKVGTVANVILTLAALYGFLSLGPSSFHADWHERAAAALARSGTPSGVVTEGDLGDLPGPLATYLRRSGAVGMPRVTNFRAHVHGRIRGGPDKPWMTFTAQQVNTYGPRPQRLFLMDATMFGLPVTVLHVYDDTTATMRGKLLSLITVVDGSGPEMDRAETVTLFNDLVILAPAAIVGAPVEWTIVDARQVRGVFTNGEVTVTAELSFDDAGDLVNFVSDDRLRSSDDKSFTQQRWSTPIGAYRDFGRSRVATVGEAHWEAPAPEGEFTYLEFHLDHIAYDAGRSDLSARGAWIPHGVVDQPEPVDGMDARRSSSSGSPWHSRAPSTPSWSRPGTSHSSSPPQRSPE